MILYEYTSVTYHSVSWALLVETGWITRFVDSGIAFMIRRIQ